MLKNINWIHVSIFLAIIIFFIFICISYQENAHRQGQEEFYQSENNNTNIVKHRQLPKAEIVLYYATWCGYSKMFLPEWEKFEKYAKDNMPDIKVTKILCEGGNESICFQKGIKGYPSVVLYPKDKTEIHFMDERKAEKIIEFINKNV